MSKFASALCVMTQNHGPQSGYFIITFNILHSIYYDESVRDSLHPYSRFV